MPFNVSELLSNPIETIFSVFTDLIGFGFYIVVLGVIAGALYIQKRDFAMVGMFMLTSGGLLAGGSLFVGYTEMAFVYTIIAGLGIASLFIEWYFSRS